VQVDPIKPTLKAPGSKRLKPNCDELLSNFAFKFKVRRYMKAKLRWLKIANILRRTDKGDMERAFGPKVVGLGLPPPDPNRKKKRRKPKKARKTAGGKGQGLTLVHISAQRKHILWDTLGA